MKKGKWLVWAGITVAVFVLARIVFHHFGVFGGPKGMVGQDVAQLQSGGFGRGGHGSMGGRGHGGHMMGFGFGSFLVQAGLFVVGWVTWKLAGNSGVRKWIGGALMTLAAMALLPKVMILPALLVAAYFVYKIKKNNKTAAVAYVPAAEVQSTATPTADYLDQWEQSVQQEEK